MNPTNVYKINGHTVTWKRVTTKKPLKIANLYEVDICGKFIPWEKFTFFAPPDRQQVIDRSQFIVSKFESFQTYNPPEIIQKLRNETEVGKLLFRDPYFNENKKQKVSQIEFNPSSSSSPSPPLASPAQNTSRLSVWSIMNSTQTEPSPDNWLQFMYRPPTASDSAASARPSLPLSISEQLNRVLDNRNSEPVKTSIPPPIQSRVPVQPLIHSNHDSAASDSDNNVTSPHGQNINTNTESLNGYVMGNPPNKPGVYVLKLNNGKYYVGQSELSVRDRIEEHKNRGPRCAYFVKKNTTSSSDITYLRPKSYIPDDLERWEEEETLHAMLSFGFENVRGYVWARLEHTLDDYKMLKRTLGGRLKCCYECGFKGHMVTKCPNVNSTNKTSWAMDLDRLIQTEQPPQISLAQSAASYMGKDTP